MCWLMLLDGMGCCASGMGLNGMLYYFTTATITSSGLIIFIVRLLTIEMVMDAALSSMDVKDRP